MEIVSWSRDASLRLSKSWFSNETSVFVFNGESEGETI